MLRSKTKNALCALSIAIAALALGGCSDKSEAKAELGANVASAKPVVKENVDTVKARQVELKQSVMLTGSLAPDEQSDVASKQTGIVREVMIDRGSVVKKGDILVQLDTVDAMNALEQSKASAAELLVRLGLKSEDEQFDPSKQPDVKAAAAELELAEKNFQRDKSLAESKVISPGEFDTTRNKYNTAKQQYDLAVAKANQLFREFQTALTRVRTQQQLLKDMTVKAPFDGSIVEKLVAPGESVMAGAQVASMVRIDPLRLMLNVPEQSVAKIHKGQKVNFQVDAFPGQKFEGVIQRISPALDPETRTLIVEATVQNHDRLLKPGLFATAHVQIDAERKGVTVPESAVRRYDNLAQVFVVDEGVAKAKMVVPGDTVKGHVEIVNGLKGGETVVSDATQVEDGVRIQ